MLSDTVGMQERAALQTSPPSCRFLGAKGEIVGDQKAMAEMGVRPQKKRGEAGRPHSSALQMVT